MSDDDKKDHDKAGDASAPEHRHPNAARRASSSKPTKEQETAKFRSNLQSIRTSVLGGSAIADALVHLAGPNFTEEPNEDEKGPEIPDELKDARGWKHKTAAVREIRDESGRVLRSRTLPIDHDGDWASAVALPGAASQGIPPDGKPDAPVRFSSDISQGRYEAGYLNPGPDARADAAALARGGQPGAEAPHGVQQPAPAGAPSGAAPPVVRVASPPVNDPAHGGTTGVQTVPRVEPVHG